MRKKRSRLILLAAIVLIIVIILAVVIYISLGTQSSNQLVAGVKKGDTFTYELQALWDSSDPKTTISNNILQVNMTDWYRVTITNVSNENISIATTWRFKNGTELAGNGTVNIKTGIAMGGFWAIYAANLNANDNIRPTGPDRSTINATETREYASGTRETNRISLVLEYSDTNDPTGSTTWTEYLNIYFDRQTGMLVELRDMSEYTNPEVTTTLVWTIKDTNVWTVS
jgi:hypothetical protein